jgi:two-component system, cell cycle sensor histidine kinase and response regulator CckA
MTSDADRYRENMRERIDRALEILARLSFAEIEVDVEKLDADDDFADLFGGIALLADDLRESRREVAEESAFAALRLESWRTALGEWTSPYEMVQALLELVGARLGVSRASLYVLANEEGTQAVCRAQWCAAGIGPNPRLDFIRSVRPWVAKESFFEIGAAESASGLDDVVADVKQRYGIAALMMARCNVGSGVPCVLALTRMSATPPWSDRQRSLLSELGAIVSMRSAQLAAERAQREAKSRLEEQVAMRTAELAQTNIELESDIRMRKKAEAALRNSEELHRGLIETSPDVVILTDESGVIVMANRAATRAFRVGAVRPLVGQRLIDFVVAEDRARAKDYWRRPAADTAAQTTDVRFRRCDGGEFLGEIHASRVRDVAWAQKGVLSNIRDVTETRRREAELLRTEKLESVGTLAAGIAHDFNNTLTAITTNLALAVRRGKWDDSTNELVNSAMDAAFRATGLTKQLLTFAKGGAPVTQCVPVADIVERAVEFCLRGSNVRSSFALAGDLWPVEVDEGQVEQALNNLVINAKQAMPEGGTIEVHAENVSAADPDDSSALERRYVHVSFADTGVGIPAENLQRIYDPYYTTKEGGTGLGLTTAYSVIKKHGGFLRCESVVGAGTVFHIYLPACAGPSSVEKARSTPPPKGAGRVLVMDDDGAVRRVIERLLRQAGYETTGTATGSEAVNAYVAARQAGDPFVAVIMDLVVPGGDGGKETMPRLLAADPDARAIVVSGYSDDPVLANHREYGFRGMLAKPFRPDELFRVLAEVIEGQPGG